MFDKAIIDTDKFMDLSMSSKALYFLLGMEADDEGFVSYKKVMRVHGGNDDDIKILIAKGFLILFESGVVVITDWNNNNYLDKNRLRSTEYQKERSLISLTENKKYVLNECLTSIEEYRREENILLAGKPAKDKDPSHIGEQFKWQSLALEIIKIIPDAKPKTSSVFKCCKTNYQASLNALNDCKELGKPFIAYFLKVYNELNKK